MYLQGCFFQGSYFCTIAVCLALGFGQRLVWAEDDIDPGMGRITPLWLGDDGPTLNLTDHPDSLATEVRALRRVVHRLTEFLERQSAESNREQKRNSVRHSREDSGPRTVMLYFTASWCGPCQQLNPVIDRLKLEGFPIRQVDVDKEGDIVKEHKVSSIPCFIMITDGKRINDMCGLATEQSIRKFLRMERHQIMEVPVIKEFRGGVSDGALRSISPDNGVVSDAQTWKNLCESWHLDRADEKIDFTSQFVLVRTSEGSGISLKLERESNGNLKSEAMYTTDYRGDGFRFLAVVVNRDGIASIDGKKLRAVQSRETN